MSQIDARPFVLHFGHNDEADEIDKVKQQEKAALAQLKECFESGYKVVVMEMVMITGRIETFRSPFVLQVRELADEYGAIIVCDEIFTGMGRTGRSFAYEHYSKFRPDYIMVGKGLGLNALVRVDRGEKSHLPLNVLRSTFDRSFTSVASARLLLNASMIIKAIREDKLIEHVREHGERILNHLKQSAKGSNHVTISGIGFIFKVQGDTRSPLVITDPIGVGSDRYQPLTLLGATQNTYY